jgi:hypothetical protein
MNIEKIDIGELKPNADNPRTIKSDKMKKLVKSIKDFPEMLEVRPIVVDDDLVVLGGNMRLEACRRAGLKEVPIIRFKDLTEERKKEFIVKDNVGFGEWDWDILENHWDLGVLDSWGLDLIKRVEEDDVEEGEMGFNEDLDFESNYVVLKFSKDIDWIQALSIFGLEKGWNKGGNGKGRSVGLGRVIDGVEAILKIKENFNGK